MSDLSHLSDEELMRQLGEASAVPAAPAASPDLSKMSDADLIAALGQPAPRPAGDDSAAIGRGIINGVPVVGPYLLGGVNRVAAGVRSVQNGTPYADELRDVESFGQRTADAHPIASAGGEMAGAVLGTAPAVAAAPAAFGAGGGALGGRMLASGLTGGALGGADAAVRSGGDLDAVKMGAGLGLGLGAAGPAIGAGAGKVAGAVASRLKPAEAGPSVAELKDAAHAAYQRADDAGVRVAQPAFAGAVGDIGQTLRSEGLDRTIHPKTTAALGRLEEAAGSAPTLREVETLRRVAGGAAGAMEADERRIGSEMIGRLDGFVDGLGPADIVAGDPTAASAALREGRDLWARSRRVSAIEDAALRGERRAATSGTGGNEDNAVRQNIRAILDNPKRVRGFTADERRAMEDVVRGTPSQNALRLVGRLSPTHGAIPALAALGMAYQHPSTAIVPAVGIAAKTLADRATKRNVDRLVEMIASGGQVAESPWKRPASAAMEQLAQMLATPAPVYTNQLQGR